ncbi:MAG: hypothetical protein F4Z22_09530 [Acidimicrobiia bacterium]|nr:hypothetical protein [Acidimicrobiia bacterium]
MERHDDDADERRGSRAEGCGGGGCEGRGCEGGGCGGGGCGGGGCEGRGCGGGGCEEPGREALAARRVGRVGRAAGVRLGAGEHGLPHGDGHGRGAAVPGELCHY